MTRNLKALGLVLLAALAINASAASAAEFHSEGTETELAGTLEGSQEIITSLGTMKCATGTYTGKMSGSTASTLTVAPTYKNCSIGTSPVEVEMNGCEYQFHAGIGGTGSTSLLCPKEKEITFTVRNMFGEDVCTLHVHPETGHRTVTYTNVGVGTTREIVKHVEIVGVTYSETKGTSFFEACKTTKTTHNMEIFETWRATGYHQFFGKTHTGIEII